LVCDPHTTKSGLSFTELLTAMGFELANLRRGTKLSTK